MAISNLQKNLQATYNRELFAKNVLKSIFSKYFEYYSKIQKVNPEPTASEKKVISEVGIYGNIKFDDGNEITCYEIILNPTVRIENSKVAITQYVKKLLFPGQGALISFISPNSSKVWRFTLLAKDSVITEKGIIEDKQLVPKRYTYLLGPSESCRTAAQRLENGIYKWEDLIHAFSVEKLSKHFFDEYKLHYEKFAQHLNESNFKVHFQNDEKHIRDFVKKLLGRIVFLYFVQKKGWLGASDTKYTDGDPNFVYELFVKSRKDSRFYPFHMRKLFFETLNRNRIDDDYELPNNSKVKIPYLNGGLFDREEFDKEELYLKPELFSYENYKDVILDQSTNRTKSHRGFLDFLNSYNFTIHEDSPYDHTVAVDPEMLSHIFENLLEDNKDKGAYYTPKEIVHYMCSQSLVEYLWTQLEKKISREDIEQFVHKKEIPISDAKQLEKIEELLDKVKICDPAIGSGAFPMGLLQEIFSLKELIAYQLNKKWNPALVKENIIQNSIYGVDIEKGAVDIARLRFWLSLVVDEEEPKPLPNLDFKIVVGDSLISKFGGEIVEIDWDITTNLSKGSKEMEVRKKLLEKITSKQKKYFHPKTEEKAKLAEEVRNLKIDILINQLKFLLETVFISKSNNKAKEDLKSTFENNSQKDKWTSLIKYLEKLKKNLKLPFHHFDWKLDFPEILNPYLVKEYAGFDIVIGNPPYIGEKGNEKIFHPVKQGNLGRRFYSRYMDYFYYFFHLSIDSVKSNGIISLITTNYYLTATGANKLRDDFKKRVSILRMINFSEVKIFESALGQHNIITFLQKGNDSNKLPRFLTSPGIKLRFQN